MATFSGPWLFRPHLQGWDAARPFLSPAQLINHYLLLGCFVSVFPQLFRKVSDEKSMS